MSLRIKLLLPTLFFGLAAAVYFYGFWMPRSIATTGNIYREAVVRHLATLENGLIPLLLNHQLDEVYSDFDELLKKNRDWKEVTLFNAGGKRLYPLSGSPALPGGENGSEVRRFERTITYRNVTLGRLVIAVDFGPGMKDIRARHLVLMVLFLAGLFVIFLLTFVFIDRNVTRPVAALSEASKGLADGDFSALLPKKHADEMGELVAGFSSMREAIGHYQSELQGEIAAHKKAQEELRESRERYRSLFRNMLEGYAYCRMFFENGMPKDFVYLDVNDAFGRLTGLDNVVGKKVSEVIPGIRETNPELFEIYGRVALTGRPEKFETCLDSLGIWLSAAVYSTEREYFVAVFDNITERKRVERELRTREEMLAYAGRMAKIGGWEFDADTMEGTWTEETALIHEVDPKAPTSAAQGLGFYRGASREAVEKAVKEAIECGKPYDLVLEMITARGTRKWVRTMGQPVREGGRIVKVRGMIQDVTEPRKAERSLRASLRFLEAIHRNTEMKPLLEAYVSEIRDYTGCDSVGVRVLDGEGGIPYLAYEGFSPEFYESESPLSIKKDRCMCINVIRGDTNPALSFYTEGGSFYINGTSRFLATVKEEEKGRTRNVCNLMGYESVALVPFRRGKQILGLIHAADHRENMVPLETVEMLERAAMQLGPAIERVRAEEALRKSRATLQSFYDSSPLMMGVTEIAGGDIIAVHGNAAIARFFGIGPEELPNLTWTGLGVPAEVNRLWAGNCLLSRTEGAAVRFEYEHPSPAGMLRIAVTVAFLGNSGAGRPMFSFIAEDVTERRKLEEQFIQAQKMEAVGLLAGGVAHDFNNILSTVVGYSHLALMKTREADPMRHDIQQILESAERAAALTQSLLAFGRKQTVNLRAIDMNEVIRKFETFLHRLIREDISIVMTCAGGVLPVMADMGQIEQVIMNLVTNARDAMPDGGKIAIETKSVSLDLESVEAHGYGRTGDYALVMVSDTGPGMDEETKSRIFEPFFTTKEQGKGTGLGLSMVYGTVKRHDGFINVYSEPGNGTTFKIYFPLAQAAPEPRAEKKEEQPAPEPGTGTILLAEDDAALRKLNTTVLEHYGYTVVQAVDGAEAVSLFSDNKERIRLVILDGIMPKMNGKEAFRKIRAMSPDVRCIFVSGYAEDIFTKSGVPGGEAAFILKPVSPVDLVKKVREVLKG